MTIEVANTEVTNTFEYWRTRTNEMATAFSNAVVTTNSNTAVGNAAITGTFSANIVVTNISTVNTSITVGSNVSLSTTSINVGNSTVNSSINSTSFSLSNSTVSFTISKPTATQVSNGAFFLNANNSFTYVAVPVLTTNTTTGTSAQEIDSYAIASYSGAEYVLSIKDNNSNSYSMTKLLTFHDTGSAYVTEYATMNSNASMGVFSAASNATHVKLSFTPVSTNATIKYIRTTI